MFVFSSSRDVLTNPPEASLGAAALALHYANLIMFIKKLAVSPLHICHDERDAYLYDMLTDRVWAFLRSAFARASTPCDDPVLAAKWSCRGSSRGWRRSRTTWSGGRPRGISSGTILLL
jgi:hypothetical protein